MSLSKRGFIEDEKDRKILAEAIQLVRVGYSIEEVSSYIGINPRLLNSWSKIMGIIPSKKPKYKPVKE